MKNGQSARQRKDMFWGWEAMPCRAERGQRSGLDGTQEAFKGISKREEPHFITRRVTCVRLMQDLGNAEHPKAAQPSHTRIPHGTHRDT
mmetsp:Transcript_28500/g.71172  ORF Transcript_28500/g.71172 Transcript_28500/m.71172 type:complete len:89 (+) Transcript_28500:814-1080(+)